MVSDYAPAVALLLVSACISLYASAHMRPDAKEKQQIAVLFPLNNTFEQNINLAARSDSRIVRVGASDHILVLEPQSPQSVATLYGLGALAIFNPSVTGACIASQTNSSYFISGAL